MAVTERDWKMHKLEGGHLRLELTRLAVWTKNSIIGAFSMPLVTSGGTDVRQKFSRHCGHNFKIRFFSPRQSHVAARSRFNVTKGCIRSAIRLRFYTDSAMTYNVLCVRLRLLLPDSPCFIFASNRMSNILYFDYCPNLTGPNLAATAKWLFVLATQQMTAFCGRCPTWSLFPGDRKAKQTRLLSLCRSVSVCLSLP